MLEFLDIVDIRWKSIFRSTKKELLIALTISYFLAGTLFFIYLLFHEPPGTNSESMDVVGLFLFYWAGVLMASFLFPAVAIAIAILCVLVITPFFMPFFFFWLGKRSKSRASGIILCALSGSTFGLLCALGFYYVLAKGG